MSDDKAPKRAFEGHAKDSDSEDSAGTDGCEPLAKHACLREDGSSLHVFDVVGMGSDKCQTVALLSKALKHVPYLEVMTTTSVGTQQRSRRRELRLPAGCTVEACVALLHWAAAKATGLLTVELSDTGGLESTLALLQTADFLMQDALMPHLRVLCERRVRTADDCERLRHAAGEGGDAVQQRLRLDGSRLLHAMSPMQIKSMLSAMASDKSLDGAQTEVLVRWLQIATRTADEVDSTLQVLQPKHVWQRCQSQPLLAPPVSPGHEATVDGGGGAPSAAAQAAPLLVLKPGAEALFRELSSLSRARPALSAPIWSRLQSLAPSPRPTTPPALETSLPEPEWIPEWMEGVPNGDNHSMRAFASSVEPPLKGSFAGLGYAPDATSGLAAFLRCCVEPALIGPPPSIAETERMLRFALQPHIVACAACTPLLLELLPQLLDRRALSAPDLGRLLPIVLPRGMAYSASFQGLVGLLLRERATLWLSDGRRFDAQELYGLLPLATLTHFKAGLASEIPHVVMRLLASASPAVQAANVEQLWSYGNGTPWASTLTCAFMGALGPDALAKLVAELLPFLGSKSLFSRKVRAFIAEGITGGLDV